MRVHVYHGNDRVRDVKELQRFDVVLTTYAVVEVSLACLPFPYNAPSALPMHAHNLTLSLFCILGRLPSAAVWAKEGLCALTSPQPYVGTHCAR